MSRAINTMKGDGMLMKVERLGRHKWVPILESKGAWGYHRHKCLNCGADTHIGLDIDYDAPECKGKPKNQNETTIS